jgi:hypothetical protein
VAFIKTTLAKATRRTRVRIPRFEKTEEWRMLQAALDQQLKPGEVLMVSFTEDDMLKYRITNRRTVARYVKKYLAVRNLPYEVVSFQLRSGGFTVQVANNSSPLDARRERIRKAAAGPRIPSPATKNEPETAARRRAAPH